MTVSLLRFGGYQPLSKDVLKAIRAIPAFAARLGTRDAQAV